MISGHKSVFSSQILAMKKSGALSIKMGEEIEKTNISLDESEKDRLEKLKSKLKRRRNKKIDYPDREKLYLGSNVNLKPAYTESLNLYFWEL